jgi:hypothetical protein
MTESTMDLSTPTDATIAPRSRKKRQRRYRLFEDGDYRVLAVSTGDGNIPRGALLTLPDVPGFLSVNHAKKFIRNSGDSFAGRQLMILRAIEILRCDVETKPRVVITPKPRSQVSGPPKAHKAPGAG